MKSNVAVFFTVAIFVLLAPLASNAVESIKVDSNAQETPLVDNGNCTLAEAIKAANENIAVDGCGAGSNIEADIIYMTPPYSTFELTDKYENQSNGLPKITENLSIECNYSSIVRKDEDGIPLFRIFEVGENAVLIIKNCYIGNGRLVGENGGGIYNGGNLLKFNGGVTLANNRALLDVNGLGGLGGGIYSEGIVLMGESAVVGNEAAFGGGVYQKKYGLKLFSSTVVNNKAAKGLTGGDGGGVYIADGTSMIADHATITGNTAMAKGGGIFNTNGEVDLRNTIVAGNVASQGKDCAGLINKSDGSNVIWSINSCTILGEKIVADPLLGTMAVKQTGSMSMPYFPLKSGSPAIDKGKASANNLHNDQIGSAYEGNPDIGAIEAVCGDKIVQSELGEQCDDGNKDDNDGCNSLCNLAPANLPVCGNWTLESGEECEDGNQTSGDGCSAACKNEKAPACGDGIQQAGEECDPEIQGGPWCSKDCKIMGDAEPPPPNCGNGKLDEGEECDPEIQGGPWCSNTCKVMEDASPPTCGNGVVEEGEACDDGNTDENDGCTSACAIADVSEPPPMSSSGGCSLIIR